MKILPARQCGALGYATVRVTGVDSEDCLDYIAANSLEFIFPPYAPLAETVLTPRHAQALAKALRAQGFPGMDALIEDDEPCPYHARDVL